MAVEYKIGGLNIIAINEITPPALSKLSEAMRLARAAVHEAVERAVIALHVVREAQHSGFDDEESVQMLHPDFYRHLVVHFRLSSVPQVFEALEALNLKLQQLLAGMRSPGLRLAEFGYHWLKPPGPGVVAYVTKPLSHILFGGPSTNGCLNTNPAGYHNSSDVNLRFNKVMSTRMEDLVDTLIHECTHKYLGTDDLCKGLPFKSVIEYEEQFRAAGIVAPLGPLQSLSSVHAINDAYVMTNYILHMPDVDLRVAAADMANLIRSVNQSIGGQESNLRVFKSIGNEDL
ncbi:hypothetical protein PSCICO_36990 [Pseudomonas cichorii]|uniref:hypothetical protein n=1 Tax=Pseudomonas cichorii TaxID=36746 RepID=UPI0019111FC2|nr:hypothetical protein [Pseudomonas cichorii]GFM88300.1 hypothetical protein PSCICO_36990 [Pseudomonas cichorii]